MTSRFGRAGTESALPDNMPAIWLITDPACPEEHARRVADGCEEEGIPLAWHVQAGSADELSRSACLRSRLETGIGLDAAGNGAIAVVSVTGGPYISRAARNGGDLRWLGQAAARISKSQPVPEKT